MDAKKFDSELLDRLKKKTKELESTVRKTRTFPLPKECNAGRVKKAAR